MRMIYSRKRMLAALLVGLALLALGGQREARAGKPCAVPKEWGRLAAVYPGSFGAAIFAFEAEDGTVRTVPANCKSPASAIDTVGRE